MTTMSIPQGLAAVYGSADFRWLGHSPEFLDDWRPPLQEMASRYGVPSTSALTTDALFVQPFGMDLLVVARVTRPTAESPLPLLFHFLVMRRTDYSMRGGEPFTLADALPVAWQQRGELPALTFQLEPRRRTVADVCRVLQRADGPSLLGAAQALVDGGRAAWIRPEHDPNLIRDLWTLLPYSARAHLWPATFAVGPTLDFHALVVYENRPGLFDKRFLGEEQTSNYPEGRYELALQTAAEANDQDALDALFARRSQAEIWRMGLWVLAGLLVLALAVFLMRRP